MPKMTREMSIIVIPIYCPWGRPSGSGPGSGLPNKDTTTGSHEEDGSAKPGPANRRFDLFDGAKAVR